MNTSVARTIEINTDHIAYDASCKRLLSEKRILAWIMKYCVSECSEMDIDDIVRCIEAPEISSVPVFSDETNAPRINGMNTVESSRYEGTVTFDLRFAASIPSPKRTISLIINVEAQADFHPGYPLPARAEYYCARLISAQKGTTIPQKGLQHLDLHRTAKAQRKLDQRNIERHEGYLGQDQQAAGRIRTAVHLVHHAGR